MRPKKHDNFRVHLKIGRPFFFEGRRPILWASFDTEFAPATDNRNKSQTEGILMKRRQSDVLPSAGDRQTIMQITSN